MPSQLIQSYLDNNNVPYSSRQKVFQDLSSGEWEEQDIEDGLKNTVYKESPMVAQTLQAFGGAKTAQQAGELEGVKPYESTPLKTWTETPAATGNYALNAPVNMAKQALGGVITTGEGIAEGNPNKVVAGPLQTLFSPVSGSIETLANPRDTTSEQNIVEKSINKGAKFVEEYGNIPVDITNYSVDSFVKTQGIDPVKNADKIQMWKDTLANIANLGMTVEGGMKLGETKAPVNMTPKVSEPFSDITFQAKVDKAFPVLKNEARNLSTRYSDFQNAFTDMVKNKEKTGLVDKAGEARNPENFVETMEAQKAGKANLYKEYTAKLTGVDKAKFEETAFGKIYGLMDKLKQDLAKENSTAGRNAITSKYNELNNLRDLSPEGLQSYIETLNQETKTGPGAPMTVKQIKAANIAGEMRKVLDESVESLEGPGYQDLRNTYKSYKGVEDPLLRAAAKELRNVPGFSDKLANVGLTVEGLNFLLTHNPQSIITGLGLKATTSLIKYLNSPQRALKNVFDMVERGQSLPNPLSPQTIIPKATSESNIPMTNSIPQEVKKVK